MGQFRYSSRSAEGEDTGWIEASSLFDASEQLRKQGVEVTSIENLTEAPRRYEPDGDRPPPAPRDVHVPARDVPGAWVMLLVGGMFAGIATIFVVIGIGLLIAGNSGGRFMTLFPLIHLTIGVGLLRHVFRQVFGRRKLYENGEVAMATVDGVGHNRKVRVNGRSPYELSWSFDVDGHRYSDTRSSFDERVFDFSPGDRLWVLYNPDDPEESVEWPKLKG